jgi:hypothetical protein
MKTLDRTLQMRRLACLSPLFRLEQLKLLQVPANAWDAASARPA